MHEATRVRPANLFSLAALFAIILVGIDLAFTLLVSDQQQKIAFADVIAPVADLLASAALFTAARHSFNHSKRMAIAWGLIGLAMFTFALGDTIWAVFELGLQEPPFPSIADVFYLAYYPFLLVGVLLLLDKPSTPGEQVTKVLDAGIVMLAAILGFWNFLLGPIAFSNAGSPLLEQIILMAYPVGDLVLLWALLRIVYNGFSQRYAAPTLLLAASLTLTVVVDCIYSYQTLVGTYVSGDLLDVGWVISVLLAGLAGVSQVTAIQSLKNAGELPGKPEFVRNLGRVRSYLPYLWLLSAYVLLIDGRLSTLPMNFLTLSIGVGVIICLVLLRQIITLLENKNLNTQLQQTMETLQDQTIELEKANEDLQNEIVERRVIEQQLTYDSLHDEMTGLPNRVLFLDRLERAIEYCKRRPEYTFAALFIDIDQFKIINDSLGHLTGDQLLISIGRRMKDCLRSSDTIARFGGDEFAILLEMTGDHNSPATVAEKIQEVIKIPFDLDGHQLYVTASIGIVTNMIGYSYPEEVLRDADIAMYQAKALGKARFEVFEIKMRSQVFSRLELEQELRTAIENGEFQLYYQPIVSMKSNRVVSLEALIRWQHPKRGLLLPGDFLFIAEESGLILPIGKWVIREACSQIKKWHEKYACLQNVSVNVNISNRQFSQPGFIEEVAEALQTNGLQADALKLEITEHVLISNYAAANEIFVQLRDLGIQLQIDDFGSGYSALSYLQHFPISAIKIDKSFIDEMGKGGRGTELIRAIVSMTRELGMEAIAEGIETGEQLSELKTLLCNFGQGFLLSKPLDGESAEKVLAKQDEESSP